MRHPLPVIRQSLQRLQELMRHPPEADKRLRVQMLYLFKSGHATTREQAADLLGVHRNTVQNWLKEYQRAGLKGLLTVRKAKGARASLDVGDQKLLRARLAQPEGFASYDEAREWIASELGVTLSYAGTYYWVRFKCGGSPKVARPSHRKKKPNL